MPDRRRLVVIFTGGTISMLPDPDSGAAVPVLRGAELLERTPGLDAIAELEALDWGLVPASHLRFSQILEIAALIETALDRDDVDGVVVVQGTDVLEETSFAWDLLHRSTKPVVVVGAMRNAAQADYDGPRNLTDAVRAAADPRLSKQGVVVVMAGAILPADDVTKTNSHQLDAFQALNDGPLGAIDADGVNLSRSRGARRILSRDPRRADPLVALITAVVSTDGDLVRAAVAGGAAGLVIEATGSGNTDSDILAAARDAMDDGTPVVLTTRCASGDVGPYYGFPGGGESWAAAGAILAGTLSGPKARIALALGLGADMTNDELRALIAG